MTPLKRLAHRLRFQNDRMEAYVDPWAADRDRMARLIGRPCPHCRRQRLTLGARFSVMRWVPYFTEKPTLVCTEDTHTWDKPDTAEDEIIASDNLIESDGIG